MNSCRVNFDVDFQITILVDMRFHSQTRRHVFVVAVKTSDFSYRMEVKESTMCVGIGLWKS